MVRSVTISIIFSPDYCISELEQRVFSLFSGISGISRAGAELRVSFRSGEIHCYQPQARPGPATRERVNWMN